jgi:diguanylate cyclase (GGDEF)-like protein
MSETQTSQNIPEESGPSDISEQSEPVDSGQITAEQRAERAEARVAELEQKLQETLAKLYTAERTNQLIVDKTRVDKLTQLPNKEFFEDWLERKVDQKTPNLWVGFVDLDHFREINALVGHDRADEILQQVAKLLQSHIRHTQDLVAHRSGDEFLIGLDGASRERVGDLGESFLEISSSIAIDADGRLYPTMGGRLQEGSMPLQMSIGFAKLQEGMSAKELRRLANKTMYEAKERGRNQFVIADEVGDA